MKSTHPPSSRSSGSGGFYAILLVLIVGVAGAAWWWWQQQQQQPKPVRVLTDPPPLASQPASVPTSSPVEVDPSAVETVREELEPKEDIVNKWLAAPSILQRLVAAVWRVSQGRSPTKLLTFIEFSVPFKAKTEGDRIYIAPESYARYDEVIDALVGVKPARAAQIYQRLRPQLNARFQQVATDGEIFNQVAKKAIARLLAVKAPKPPIEIVEVGGTYYFASDDIQAWSDADKHVLRLGPKNIARFQAWLRRFARAADLL